MNFNTQGRRHQIMCTLVYINMSFWTTKTKLSTVKCYWSPQCVIFVIKNVDFGNQKQLWTDKSVTNSYSMSASIYSVDNLCKRIGQNKVQQNISLICPNLNLNQLFFDALLEFLFALRLKSTAMVIAGRSVHLTTLFPGQAWTSG